MVTREGQIHLELPLAEAIADLPRPSTSIPMSWSSWGEWLVVQGSGVDNDAVVRVTSKTPMPTQLLLSAQSSGPCATAQSVVLSTPSYEPGRTRHHPIA